MLDMYATGAFISNSLYICFNVSLSYIARLRNMWTLHAHLSLKVMQINAIVPGEILALHNAHVVCTHHETPYCMLERRVGAPMW